MAKAQHRTAEYRRAEAECKRLVQAGAAMCVEPVCLFPTRLIPAWFAEVKPRLWSVSHNETGDVILGPSHKRCNLSEAASRGNRMRVRPRRLAV